MRYLLPLLFLSMFCNSLLAKELSIGLIPEQNILRQMQRYQPLGQYLEGHTGIAIKFVVLPRYGNIVDNFKELGLDGAFWGSFTGALAINKLGVKHIARPVNPDGTSSYRGYLFVRKDSKIENVEDMEGRIMAYVDRATTAGYLFPMAYLREQGVANPDTYFKEAYFSGSHDASILAVLQGDADVGAAKNTIYDRLITNNKEAKNQLVILASSLDVPSNGLGLASHVSDALATRLKKALLSMADSPQGKEVLQNFGIKRFVETSKQDYKPVFDMSDKAGINLDNYDYRNK